MKTAFVRGTAAPGRPSIERRRIGRRLPALILLALLPASGMAAPQAAKSAPSNSAAALTRAHGLIAAGKNAEAIELLKPISLQRPEPRGVEAALGKAYYQQKSLPDAITHLEAALREKPDDAESGQLLGLSDYLLGRATQAVPLLEQAQARLPRPDPSGAYVLGTCYLQTHQYDKARAAFAVMFSVPQASAGAYLALGQMMMHQNLEDQAVPELKQALALDSHIPLAHFLLGEAYLYRSRVEEALNEFQAELKVNPISWLAYWRMGDAYSRLGRWDDAERALKQSIWLDQTFTGPYVLLGKVELRKGDAPLAAGFLQRAIRMDPNNASAHYLLGSAYQQLGLKAEAQKEFAASRKLQPDEKR